MIKISNTRVSGFEAAFRGLRNPMNSWDKSDSYFGVTASPFNDYDFDAAASYINPELEIYSREWEKEFEIWNNWILRNGILQRDIETDAIEYAYIGKNDMTLAQRMIKAGDDEGKFARMIHIQADVIAPLYWWKEYDTYKVSTTANSCSTMHKIHSSELTIDDFAHEYLYPYEKQMLCAQIDLINASIRQYNNTKEKRDWWQIIQLLPSSFLQKRTIDLNYQTARNMYFSRKSHKLEEWRTFANHLFELPYGEELIGVK